MEQRHVYFRAPNKYPYGLTEDQIREAVNLYDRKVKIEIIATLMTEFPLFYPEEDESILELVLRAIELATTEGMKMSIDHMDVIQYYRERQKEQEKPTYNVTRYEFQEGKGISGVLLPNGEFIMCGNAEHYMVVEDITFEIQKQCVYFSSFLEGENGVITLSPFGDKTITGDQTRWIENNIRYLDADQKKAYKSLMQS